MNDSPSVNADHRVRVKVFVDFWNFQLSINNAYSNFRIDWAKLGPVLARESLNIIDPTANLDYQGMNVYGSYDPGSLQDRGLFNWARNTLDKFAGVQVTMLPRRESVALLLVQRATEPYQLALIAVMICAALKKKEWTPTSSPT